MSHQVESILCQIDGLNQEELLELELRLLERSEAEWQREVSDVRATAQRQGIDQQRIDDAIANLRYGS